jgi:site-specific DNA-cytosine methylase
VRLSTHEAEIRHFHFCCGLGAAALGFNRGRAEANGLKGKFRCIGGVDSSEPAIRDFTRLTGVPGTALDLFDREQYKAFHGAEPPTDWREASVSDIQRAAGDEHPHIVFISAPCKGFSGLLSESRSKSEKYQALNRLTLRCVFLMCEAWKDDPVELIVFENVPRIATRGRALLDQIKSLLGSYSYAVAETFHDCGEIGGLAQSRKRFLMVARHVAKVRPFLYEPPKRPLRAVGEILNKLPLPGDLRGGPMHAIPNLQWKTWVRLAFVEAGSDWRSLSKLRVVDGKLADYLLVPEYHDGYLGVNRWEEPSGTIAGRSTVTNGAFSVADPRHPQNEFGALSVEGWGKTSGTITGQRAGNNLFIADPRHTGPAKFNDRYRIVRYDSPAQSVTGAGPQGQSVADPRFPNSQGEHGTKYLVQPWEGSSRTITGSDHVGSGALCIADPRPDWKNRYGNLSVQDWDDPSSTVIAGGKGVQGGWLSVADPRINLHRSDPYGVAQWSDPSSAIIGHASHDNGKFSVADPRLPEPNEKMVAIIRALDGTWHRPFTTLELAALQSLVDPDNLFDLDGNSDSAKRERIGNAVPPAAAQAIADLMGQTLLMEWTDQTFALSALPIWVKPIAVALSAKTEGAIL